MNYKTAFILGVSLLTLSFDASSTNFGCIGEVTYLGMEGNGNVFVSVTAGDSNIHSICNVNEQGAFGVTTAACKSIYATLLLARATGRAVALYYNDSTFSCATIKSWGTMPSLYFVELK